uniref:Bm11008 n=1 Tax=Brugia malayi TaxID=6279 RepID=A0A1I9G2M9_BRUMA|nr:Bm11008 [Brugia malayi]
MHISFDTSSALDTISGLGASAGECSMLFGRKNYSKTSTNCVAHAAYIYAYTM